MPHKVQKGVKFVPVTLKLTKFIDTNSIVFFLCLHFVNFYLNPSRCTIIDIKSDINHYVVKCQYTHTEINENLHTRILYIYACVFVYIQLLMSSVSFVLPATFCNGLVQTSAYIHFGSDHEASMVLTFHPLLLFNTGNCGYKFGARFTR